MMNSIKKALIRIRSAYRFRRDFRRRYALVLRDLEQVRPEGEETGRVLFNLYTAVNIKGLSFEIILASCLHRMGAKTMVMVDDGLLDPSDIITEDDAKTPDVIRRRQRFAKRFLRRFPNVRFYSDLVDRQLLERIDRMADEMTGSDEYTAEGVDLWPYIESSIVRYFRSAVNEWKSEPEAERVKRMFTRNGLISLYAAISAGKSFRPDRFISSHGIYTNFGPPYRYFKNSGINSFIYGIRYMKPNSVVFSKEGIVANGFDDGFIEKAGETIEFGEARKMADEIMGNRNKGQALDIQRMTRDSHVSFDIAAIEEMARDNEVYALFPNVLWDASIIESNVIFGSSSEWILRTVDHFSKQDGMKLIVRAHPSEHKLMTPRVTARNLIENHFGKPVEDIRNLVFIGAEVRMKSYEMFPFLSAGIVYNGTIGMEMIYHDIPVLVAGIASYSFLPTVSRFKDQDEYFRAIGDIAALKANQLQHKDELYRFLYQYFLLSLIPLGYLKEDGSYIIQNGKSTAILEDPNLNYIAETVLGKHEFFQGWKNWQES